MSNINRKGIPNIKISGINHYNYKGDKVGFGALHEWVIKNLGQPTTCEHCHKTNLTDHQIHWANKSHLYKRDLTDWLRLCVSCHHLYDKSARPQFIYNRRGKKNSILQKNAARIAQLNRWHPQKFNYAS